MPSSVLPLLMQIESLRAANTKLQHDFDASKEKQARAQQERAQSERCVLQRRNLNTAIRTPGVSRREPLIRNMREELSTN